MRKKRYEVSHVVVLIIVVSICLSHCMAYRKGLRTLADDQVMKKTSERRVGFCAPLEVITASEVDGDREGTERPTEDIWEKVEFPPVPKYMLNIHNPVTEDIFISGSTHAQRIWDPYIWDLFVRILQEAPSGALSRAGLVVDVGANIGYFTMMAAALGYDVVSFEPMAHNLRKLRSSVRRNGFGSRVTIIDRVVAQTAGARVVLVATHPTNQGNGHIVNVDTVSNVDRYYSETTTLDAVLVPMKRDILLMKIDVEGSETAVLDGAYSIIRERTVHFITLEISDATRDNRACSLVAMLRAMQRMGYVISDVTPGAPPLSVDSIDRFPPNILLSLSHVSVPAGM